MTEQSAALNTVRSSTTLLTSVAFKSNTTYTCAPRPHLVGHTGHPEARSFPWSCSEDRVPSHYASGLPKTGVEIRRSQVVQGTRKEASEGYVCKLEDWEGTLLDTHFFIRKTHLT